MASESAEVIIRFEQSDGSKTAYAIDYDACGVSMAETWPDVERQLPGWMRMPVDGFLFAMRHGPLPRILREKGLAPLARNSGNAGALSGLMRLLGASMREEQAKTGGVLDLPREELMAAAAGQIRRAPEYDAPALLDSLRDLDRYGTRQVETSTAHGD